MKVPMSDTRSAMSRFRKIKTRRGRHGLGNTTGADRLGSDILKRLYINLPSCSRVGGSAVFCVVFRTGMKELIGRAVVIEVTHGDAHSPTRRSQASRSCHIRKVETARGDVLVVQRDHQITAFEVLFDGGIIDYCDVQPAVVVAIKQCDATTSHGIENIPPIRARVGHCGQPHLCGYVAEMHAGLSWLSLQGKVESLYVSFGFFLGTPLVWQSTHLTK